jgi:agmatine deiminase
MPEADAPIFPPAHYRLPAEWEPQAAVWLAWPHRQQTFLGDFAEIPPAFVRLVQLLVSFEPVRVIGSREVLADAEAHLAGIASVEFIEIPTNDSWLRDTGPVFLQPRQQPGPPVAVAFDFNAWGGKYPPWDDDAAVASKIAQRLGLQVIHPGIVLEGGALETDGEGTLIVNHRCIEDSRRNPGLSRDELTAILKRSLCIDKVLWIGGELAGDDTDGHVDQLARFVAPGHLVAARQPDRADPNHEPLEVNIELLRSLTDARGRPLRVTPIELPSRESYDGVQLPASYLNFLIVNGGVILPTFGHPLDGNAIDMLSVLFADRLIRPYSARELIRGRGAVHCVTRDQPVIPHGVPE